MIKFKEIKTRDELLTRIIRKNNGLNVLSCGNQYGYIYRFLSRTKTNDNMIEVEVFYTAGSGEHSIIRFI
jgi:hypothetical protein